LLFANSFLTAAADGGLAACGNVSRMAGCSVAARLELVKGVENQKT
jgi:hypothetical protein